MLALNLSTRMAAARESGYESLGANLYASMPDGLQCLTAFAQAWRGIMPILRVGQTSLIILGIVAAICSCIAGPGIFHNL